MNIDKQKQHATNWFKKIRDKICKEFELIDNSGQFEYKNWQREGGGGGQMAIMKGKIFEKVGVNISTVYGKFSPEFAKQIPGAREKPEFWASGISLVAHMCSPFVPAVHMNTRYIVTQESWFGGGTDLTPIFPNKEDNVFFHNKLKEMCDKYDKSYYPTFKKQADDYFYLPNRKEARGIGGIFYDNLNTGNFDKDFAFTKDVGEIFLQIYSEIVKKNMAKSWTQADREYQLEKRGRYVEFNLLYDRGTKFGVMTNGNPDAYLMSMPPLVKWS